MHKSGLPLVENPILSASTKNRLSIVEWLHRRIYSLQLGIHAYNFILLVSKLQPELPIMLVTLNAPEK